MGGHDFCCGESSHLVLEIRRAYYYPNPVLAYHNALKHSRGWREAQRTFTYIETRDTEEKMIV